MSSRTNSGIIVPGLVTPEPTWGSIGTDVAGRESVIGTLEDAGLLYKVVSKPVYRREGGRYRKIPGQYQCMRKNDNHYYNGIVTDRYNIVQNKDAFGFVDYLSTGVDMEFVKAGETKSGIVYIIVKFPDFDVLGDQFTQYGIFCNSFGGKSSIKIAFCHLRVVCANQLTIAYRESSNTIAVEHNSKADENLKKAAAVAQQRVADMNNVVDLAQHYVQIKLSPRQIQLAIDALFRLKDGATQRQIENNAKRKIEYAARFKAAMDAPDNYHFKGTAWQAVNAYTDILTHTPLGKNTTAENRFMNVTFGNDTKHFLDIIEDVAVA